MKVFSDFTSTEWSKGLTSELFIYPADSSLEKRDFDFRISIATISGQSKFTPFVGYNRILTLLEGELELIHKENHTANLLPFDQDHFKGKWTTYSTGVAKDFNVISKEHIEAFVEVVHLRPEQTFSASEPKEMQLIYIDEGSINIESKEIKSNSLLLIETDMIDLKANENSVIIICSFINIH
jgi:environmental stress-induced protein Ves